MVDPQNLTGVKQHPEPPSPRNRNRGSDLSTTNPSHSVKYEPDSDNGRQPSGPTHAEWDDNKGPLEKGA